MLRYSIYEILQYRQLLGNASLRVLQRRPSPYTVSYGIILSRRVEDER